MKWNTRNIALARREKKKQQPRQITVKIHQCLCIFLLSKNAIEPKTDVNDICVNHNSWNRLIIVLFIWINIEFSRIIIGKNWLFFLIVNAIVEMKNHCSIPFVWINKNFYCTLRCVNVRCFWFKVMLWWFLSYISYAMNECYCARYAPNHGYLFSQCRVRPKEIVYAPITFVGMSKKS